MRDLVVFGEDWGAHPSSTQHLVSRLAKGRKVLWVNSLGLRRPRLTMKDARRGLHKVKSHLFGASPAAAGGGSPPPFPVLHPFVLPLPGSTLAQRINGHLLGAGLRRPLARWKLNRPLLWASLPTALAALGRLGEEAVVYYCGDDFGALEGVDHAAVLGLEARLAARADLIIAASEELATRFPQDRTLYLPHGVDFDLFAKPAAPAHDLPLDAPTAGYYGSISSWIDLDAISAAASALPSWRFILIGEVRTDVSPLRKHPNIRFLGPRPHNTLPSYVQHWTVSLIPFRDTPQIRACNPLKLREYLAAGRPIASTLSFPALGPYASLIPVAKSANAFADAILESESRSAGETAARRAAVQGESWDARAATLAAVLEAL